MLSYVTGVLTVGKVKILCVAQLGSECSPQIAVIDRNIHLPLQERSTRYVHYRGFRQAELFQTSFLAFISCNICCSHICAMQNKDKGPSVIAKIY